MSYTQIYYFISMSIIGIIFTMIGFFIYTINYNLLYNIDFGIIIGFVLGIIIVKLLKRTSKLL